MTGGNRRTHTYMTGVHIPDWRTHIYIHMYKLYAITLRILHVFGLLRILT